MYSYLLVLSIAKFSKRVSSFPSIPCEYIHIAIHPKEQLPTIVICGWFFKFQKIPKRTKIRRMTSGCSYWKDLR